MSLDPASHKNWKGFIDLLRPPAGYKLVAAVGTSFGMGFDALVAALLGMIDADSETPTTDTLSGLVAATRLSSRVRVYVHAGSVSGRVSGVPQHLLTLLDRTVVPVWPERGLFHPKVWVSQFTPLAAAASSPDLVRLFVGSRNLALSTSMELGTLFEGECNGKPNQLAKDASRALSAMLRAESPSCKPVEALVKTLASTEFALPHDAGDECRLLWQQPGYGRVIDHMPKRIDKALLVSPFLGGPFLQDLLARTETLQVLSTVDAFRKLDQETFDLLSARTNAQKACSTYVVRDCEETEDMPEFSGLHGKLLLAEGDSFGSVMYTGSANATEAGWGMSGAANVETMLAIRPGVPLRDFMKAVVADAKGKPRPWVDEFSPDLRTALTPEEILADQLRQFVCQMAGLEFRISYIARTQTVTVTLVRPSEARSATREPDVKVEIALAAVTEDRRWWHPLASLQTGPLHFTNIEIAEVSAFLIVRCTHTSGASDSRSAFGRLTFSDSERDDRDARARAELSSSISRDELISALILGVSRARALGRRKSPDGDGPSPGHRSVLGPVSLEDTLRAVAERPEILQELRLLLGDSDPALLAFRREIESVLAESQVAV